MPGTKSFLYKRIQSFAPAFNGFSILLREEPNARLHLLAAVIVLFMGFYFNLPALEWLFVGVAIAGVFITELLNTAIETLSDFVCQEWDPKIKKIKDLAAAAVLGSAIFALLIGLVIFLPRFLNL